MMKNITLSADADILAQMRLYAKEHNTTVNQIVRDHFSRLLEEKPGRDVLAEKLDRLVEKYAGYPEGGWRFDRAEIYLRGEQVG